MEVWTKVTLRAHWPGPPQPDGARPGPNEGWFDSDWFVPFVPIPGDEIELPAQPVAVAERSIRMDGSVVLYLGPFDGWERESVENLMAGAREYVAKRAVELEKAARPTPTIDVKTPINYWRRQRGSGGSEVIRITTNGSGRPPVDEGDAVILNGPRDDSVQGVVRSISFRDQPRAHHVLGIEVDWMTFRH